MHSKVERTVVDAYQALASTMPGVRFVYGETGWARGGRIKPHRTHQNGLSVDFMVPVRDAQERTATLPRDMGNRYGYDLEFDAQGRLGELRIDFAAVAAHLYELEQFARRNGIGLKQVIFDTRYLPKLFAAPRGEWLKANLHFMPREPWIRHDEHYHVDFDVPCEPL